MLGPILIQLNNSSTVYEKVAADKFTTGFQVPEQELLRENGQLKSEKIPGFLGTTDTANYRVWHNTDARRGDPGRYLINMQGQPVYLVDPGINGTVEKVQTGVDDAGNPVYQTVEKYRAPKATLMSYIIKGILSQELPWGLVLLGVMIAVTLELCGISSLAFAVGLYLPISASAPIFVGGIVRWAVDKYLRRKLARQNLTEEEIIAETDKSPGVLLASGYIAGGALAGIILAVASVYFAETVGSFTEWSEANNPFFAGPNSDWLGLIPFWLSGNFALLCRTRDDFCGKEK